MGCRRAHWAAELDYEENKNPKLRKGLNLNSLNPALTLSSTERLENLCPSPTGPEVLSKPPRQPPKSTARYGLKHSPKKEREKKENDLCLLPEVWIKPRSWSDPDISSWTLPASFGGMMLLLLTRAGVMLMLFCFLGWNSGWNHTQNKQEGYI